MPLDVLGRTRYTDKVSKFKSWPEDLLRRAGIEHCNYCSCSSSIGKATGESINTPDNQYKDLSRRHERHLCKSISEIGISVDSGIETLRKMACFLIRSIFITSRKNSSDLIAERQAYK